MRDNIMSLKAFFQAIVMIMVLLSGCEMALAQVVTVTTLAGGVFSGSADGQGTSATFNSPKSVAVDASGNVYVADSSNNSIRKIDAAGNVTTIAGGSFYGGFSDGKGKLAKFNFPTAVAVDASGTIYVADHSNNRIRKMDAFGNVTTVAGSTFGFADGQGVLAKFSSPSGVAVGMKGNIYVADTFNNRIRKIDPSGNVTTVAGNGAFGTVDGQGAAARFDGPTSVAVDASGNLYVADTANNSIRKIDPSGNVITLAGGTFGFADGQGVAAKFGSPSGVAVDTGGNLYVADTANNRIRKIDASGNVTTVAGSSSAGNVDGQGAIAQFRNPMGIAVDASGNLYVADKGNARIRKITGVTQTAPTGVIAGMINDATGGKYGAPKGVIAWINNAKTGAPVGSGTVVAGANGFSFNNLSDGVYEIGAVLDMTGGMLTGGQNGFDARKDPTVGFVGNPITITNGVAKDKNGLAITNVVLTVTALGDNVFGSVTDNSGASVGHIVVQLSDASFANIWATEVVPLGGGSFQFVDMNFGKGSNVYARACIHADPNVAICGKGDLVDQYANSPFFHPGGGTQLDGVNMTISSASLKVGNQGYSTWSLADTDGTNKWINLAVNDSNKRAKSVTIQGGSFSVATPVSYNGADWNIQDNSPPASPTVAAPTIYTFTITNQDGSVSTATTRVTFFVADFLSNVQAVESNGKINLSWSDAANAGQMYEVHFVDSTGKWLWGTPFGLTAKTYTYDGPALTPGSTYEVRFWLEQKDVDGDYNKSLVRSSFVYQGGSTLVPNVVITSPNAQAAFVANSTGNAVVPISISSMNHAIIQGGTHWHLIVDGVDKGAQFSTLSSVILAPGTHTITVELRNKDHSQLVPKVTNSISISVNGSAGVVVAGSITGTVTDATKSQYGTAQARVAWINDANWNPVGTGFTIAATNGSFSFTNLPDGTYNIGAVLDMTGAMRTGGQNGFDPLRDPIAPFAGNPITLANGVMTDVAGKVITSVPITVNHLGNNIMGNVTNNYSNAPVVVEYGGQTFGSIWNSYTMPSGTSSYIFDGVEDSVNGYLRACSDDNSNGKCDIGEAVDVYANNAIAVAGGLQANGVNFTITASSPTVTQGYNVWGGTGVNSNSRWMQLGVDDLNGLAKSVTVTGGGFTTGIPMTLHGNRWDFQDKNATMPASYTVTISNNDGATTTYAVQAGGYVTNMAVITVPSTGSSVSGDLAISWTGTLQQGQLYHVQLVDKNNIWHDITPYPGITGNSWIYRSGSKMNDGQVLIAGSVEVRVYTEEASAYGANNSVASSVITYNVGGTSVTSSVGVGVKIHVQDVNGKSVQGAVVYVPSSPYSTLTDISGNGSIKLQSGIGYQLQVDTGDVVSVSTVVGGWWLDSYADTNGVNIGGWDFTNGNTSPLYVPPTAGGQLSLVLDVGIPVTVSVQDASYATVANSWTSFGSALDKFGAPHSWISMGATNASSGKKLAGALQPGTYVIMDSKSLFVGAPSGNNTTSAAAQRFTVPSNARSVHFNIVQDSVGGTVSAIMTVTPSSGAVAVGTPEVVSVVLGTLAAPITVASGFTVAAPSVSWSSTSLAGVFVDGGQSSGSDTSTALPNFSSFGPTVTAAPSPMMGMAGAYGTALIQFSSSSLQTMLTGAQPINANPNVFGSTTGPAVAQTAFSLVNAGIPAGTEVIFTVNLKGVVPQLVAIMGDHASPTANYDPTGFNGQGSLIVKTATFKNNNAAMQMFDSTVGFMFSADANMAPDSNVPTQPLGIIAQVDHWVGDIFPLLPGFDGYAAVAGNGGTKGASLTARCGTTIYGPPGETRTITDFIADSSLAGYFGAGTVGKDLAIYVDSPSSSVQNPYGAVLTPGVTNFGTMTGTKIKVSYTFASPKDIAFGVATKPSTVTINLQAGWNLIGMSVSDTNYSTPKAFASLVQSNGGQVLSIWDYADAGYWRNWDANNPVASDPSFTTLHAGKGYWVLLAPNAVNVTVNLTGQTSVAALQPGWNLVAPATTVTDLATYKPNSVSPATIWGYGNNMWESYIANAPAFLNSLKSMKLGSGYYVENKMIQGGAGI